MSVIIKGMDKETAMRLCSYAGIRMEGEDFIEIPPHGRLIDADVLMSTIKEHDYRLHDILTDTTKPGMFTFGIEYAICNAPTIVEAEEQV